MINRFSARVGASLAALSILDPARADEGVEKFAYSLQRAGQSERVTSGTFLPSGGSIVDAERLAAGPHIDASHDIMDPRFRPIDAVNAPVNGSIDAGKGAGKFAYSFNVALTSDYMFRGFSQTAGRPTGQAGFDITYGMVYAGVWGSGLDFGREGGHNVAGSEIDFFIGIKPKWHAMTFDFGAIYYAYPNARDRRTTIDGELDYFELKGGMTSPLWRGATISTTYFLAPDYTNDTGRVITSESVVTQELPQWGIFTPYISAMFGTQMGKDSRFRTLVSNGPTAYLYWNAGVTLAADKFSFDFRYWDTSIKNDNSAVGNADNFCKGTTFRCDERYVATLKFTY